VTAEIEKITSFWLTEMDVDGFRLDAIKHLIEEGRVQESTPATLAWIAGYSAFIRATKPASYTVGEVAGAGTDALLPYYPDLLDAYFHFELAQGSLNAANFGQARQLAGIATGAADRLPDGRVATFLANHDQPRTGTQLDGDEADANVAATLLLTLPGTPFLYYGEEIGMVGDKPDERIRTPMQWSSQPGGGFTTGTPWQPFQDDAGTRTVAAQDADPASLLNTYRRLIHARAAIPALQHGDFTPLQSGDPNVFAFLRQDGEQRVLVLINLGTEPAEPLPYTAPAGALPVGAYTAQDALGASGNASVQVDAAGAVIVSSPDGPLPAKTGVILPLIPSGA
jgi:alpha-amylase